MQASTQVAVVSAAVVALAISACGGGDPTQHGTTSDHSKHGEGEIAALSPQRISDLLAGRGARYALAAELNQHPGPLHVLELADALELTEEQKEAVVAARRSMLEEARSLGHHLLSLEEELDRSFGTGTATAETVQRLTAQIAEVEGELRNAHLQGHLQMVRILWPEQIARYEQLRGYAP